MAQGGTIDTLYLQDRASDSRDLYPTLAVGLPAIPEPVTGLLVMLGGVGAMLRRSRPPARC